MNSSWRWAGRLAVMTGAVAIGDDAPADVLADVGADAPDREARPVDETLRHPWRWRQFTTEHGLPSVRIYQVIETEEGTPWVVTAGGIAWFDGYRWDDAPALGLSAAYPATISPAGGDRVLVVHDGRVYRGNQHGFETLPIDANDLAVSAAASADGSVLAVIRRAGGTTPRLVRIDGDTLAPVDGASVLPWPSQLRLRTTRAGHTWLSGGDGLLRYADGQWKRPVGEWSRRDAAGATVVENQRGDGLASLDKVFMAQSVWEWGPDGVARVVEPFRSSAVMAADVSPSGEAIVSVESPALWVRTDGEWSPVSTLPAHCAVTSLRYRSNGDLWVATPTGLWLHHRAGRTWDRIHDGPGGRANRVHVVLAARDGAVWMGTPSGVVVRRPDGTTARFEEVDGVSLGIVTGLAEDSSGAIWLTSGSAFGGSFRYRGGEWRRFGPADGLDAPFVHAVERDRAGRLWFLGLGPMPPETPLGDGPGAFVLDGDRFERWDVDRGLVGNRVYAFVETGDGARWFGTYSGLSRWRDGSWDHWTVKDGLRTNRVFTMAADRERVWFGHQNGSRGLGSIGADDKVVYIAEPDEISRENVLDLAVDSYGLLWVASEGGVYIVRDGVPTWVGGDLGWRRGRVLTVVPLDDRLHLGTAAQGVVTREFTGVPGAEPVRISIAPVTLTGRSALVRWSVDTHEAAWPQMRRSRVRLDDGPWLPWTDRTETLLEDVGFGAHDVTVESRDSFGRTPTVVARAVFAIAIPLHSRAAFLVPAVAVVGLLVGATSLLFVRRRRTARVLRVRTRQLTAVTDAMAGFLARGTWEQPSARLLRSALEQTRSDAGFIGVLTSRGSLLVLAEEHMRWEDLGPRAATDNGMIMIDEPETLLEATGEASLAPGILATAIRRGDDLVGLIGITRPADRELTPEEQDWIETLCRAAGLLYDSYRRRQRETELFEERTRAEKALRLSEERFRGLVESTRDWVWETDVDGCFTYCSPPVEKILGYTPEELLGRRHADLISAEEWQRIQPIIVEIIMTRKPLMRLEHVKRHKDGHDVAFETSGVPYFSADGTFRGYRGIARDVTGRRRAEAELRRRGQLERLLFLELDHRVRNHLASLISLIDLTRRHHTDVGLFAASIRGRIEVMARVHTLLSGERWRSIRLRSLVDVLVLPGTAGSFELSGPEVFIPPRQITALAMVVHELMTNSVKYGALRECGGTVHLDWTVEEGDDATRVAWTWRETGGPAVAADPPPGTGTSLIEGLTRCELQGTAELLFAPEGVRHSFSLTLDAADRPGDAIDDAESLLAARSSR